MCAICTMCTVTYTSKVSSRNMQCADNFDINALHNHMCILTFKVCSVAIMLICWSILFEICKQCTLQSGMYLLNNVRQKGVTCSIQFLA